MPVAAPSPSTAPHEPMLIGDSLYWGVDLYSASSTYPLSRHVRLLGEDRSYLRHAAVAVVQASTGEISIVPDSLSDPVTRTWREQRRFTPTPDRAAVAAHLARWDAAVAKA